MTSLHRHPASPHAPSAPANDLLAVTDLDSDALRALLDVAARWKSDPQSFAQVMRGRSVILVFEKPSLRTRVSFEVGLTKLGAHALYYDQSSSRIGERESVEDFGRTLERYVDAIVARTFSHDALVQLADAVSIPIVNALSDDHHPCQALADVMTMREHGVDFANDAVVYVGDGNNVCHSLVEAVVLLGGHARVVSPGDCRPDEAVVARVNELASRTGGSLELHDDPNAIDGARVIYTDTWTSMGQSRDDAKLASLEPFRIDAARLARAHDDVLFMHCLPAHRGEEVTAEVIDGPHSVVFDQAENRLHAQNAWFIRAFGGA